MGAELRQLNELIDRIETNRPDLAVNILNILNNQNKKQIKQLGDRLFNFPEDMVDAEFKEKIDEEEK